MFAAFNTLSIQRPSESDVLTTPSLYVSDSGFLGLFALLVFSRFVEYKCLLSQMGFEQFIVFYMFVLLDVAQASLQLTLFLLYYLLGMSVYWD